MENFDKRLDSFVDGCNKIIVNYFKESNFVNLTPPKVEITKGGRKYAKLVRDNSVHCFVNKSNGDILKAASYAAPAKHARGNIFAEDNGLDCMGPFGAAYLR